MADFNSSTAMNMPIPVVGLAPGPDWASYLNNCLNIIDQHTHSSGSGNPITPDGLSISGDLSFQQNNATFLRTIRFSAQASTLSGASDVGCAYVSGVDLYFNDANGNIVRITQSGGVAGSPGSIANLTSPASASYSAGTQTFVWQSGANIPANLDAGSVVVRNLTAGSNGITISPPNALGASYVLTLPASPPVSTKIVTIDSSGALSGSYDVDNSTLEVSSNTLQVKNAGITTGKYADQSVTPIKLAARQFVLSSGSGSYSLINTYGTTFNAVTNLSVSITTTGRPIKLEIVPDVGASSAAYFSCTGSGATPIVQFFRGSTGLGTMTYAQSANYPASALGMLDTGVVSSAGTYTYTLQVRMNGAGSNAINCVNLCLLAYEL